MSSISNEKLNEYIRLCYEVASRDNSPVNASEAARRLEIPVSWASWCLRYLVKIGDLEMRVVNHEYKESSPLPPKHMDYIERHAWMDAKFYFNPKFVEIGRVEEKIKSYKRASWAGLQIAKKSEDYLMEACLRITKNLIKTPFNSSYPDCVLIDKEFAIEISVRVENLIDSWYVNKKKELKDEKYPDFNMLIIAPGFDDYVWKKYKRKITIGYVNLEIFPFKNMFPVFEGYSNYLKDIENFARKAKIISANDYVNGLEKIVRGYT